MGNNARCQRPAAALISRRAQRPPTQAVDEIRCLRLAMRVARLMAKDQTIGSEKAARE